MFANFVQIPCSRIRLLEEAELVTTEKVGRVRRCMLAPYAFGASAGVVDALLERLPKTR